MLKRAAWNRPPPTEATMSELFNLWYEYGYWHGIMNGAAIIVIAIGVIETISGMRCRRFPTEEPEGEK